MEQQQSKRGTLRPILLAAVPLFAILAAAFWYAARAWWSLSGPPMPTTGYVALALGVVFSLLVGCGLMALLFYSSRHGYDEPYRAKDSDQPRP
jgi:Na+/melibiose symporter-like transporter